MISYLAFYIIKLIFCLSGSILKFNTLSQVIYGLSGSVNVFVCVSSWLMQYSKEGETIFFNVVEKVVLLIKYSEEVDTIGSI